MARKLNEGCFTSKKQRVDRAVTYENGLAICDKSMGELEKRRGEFFLAKEKRLNFLKD